MQFLRSRIGFPSQQRKPYQCLKKLCARNAGTNKYEVRFNAWTERSEIRGAGEPWVARQDWHLDKLARIGSSDPHNYRPAESTFRRAIDSLARESTVDPARDLLVKLQGEWDGHKRLHSWLSHACGVPYDAYHQTVGQCILLGIVARIRQPGVKFDLMPVFVSEVQGTSKSTLVKMLALDDDYFTDSIRLGDPEKELVLSLAGKTVAEISEMRTRGEVDAVKAMISATHDEGRPAYGRSIVKRPRRNIFCGTTNRLEFLEDPTGARRFLPIVVQGEINLDIVRQQLPQLIGEAATLQSRGVDINLPRELWATAAEHQAAATSQSSAEVLLNDWFAGEAPCWISPANLVLLLRVALGRDVSRGAYAPAMAKLGFVSKTRRVGNDSPRVWVRGVPDPKALGYAATLSPGGRPQLQHWPRAEGLM
jgi:predicted P-loop ATPase